MWKQLWEKILELFTNPEKEISSVDLGVELDRRAEFDGRGLHWRDSVVDFLVLIGIDSSAENREALAKELGVSKKFKVGSGARNEALRKAVFKKIMESGGSVPAELLN